MSLYEADPGTQDIISLKGEFPACSHIHMRSTVPHLRN